MRYSLDKVLRQRQYAHENPRKKTTNLMMISAQSKHTYAAGTVLFSPKTMPSIITGLVLLYWDIVKDPPGLLELSA